MKLIKKYKYKKFNRIDGEKRLYQTGKIKVPSVTTILKKTQPEEKTKSLEKWKQRVGQKEAEKIRDDAGALGTALHKCLEKYILNKRDLKYFDDTPLGRRARKMANIIIGRAFFNLDEVWGCEVHLAGENYAGTTDVVGIFDGKPAIIDFKQTNRPKREEWIEDYYLQLTAYALAHNYSFGTSVSQGYILMCSREGYFQQFHLTPDMFPVYSEKWKKRLEAYYA
jgi:hypothetical protein|tara:strand:- start:9467 stop:10138 length:672 start_codon:yes stop_codon:yes gene_type:complete